MPLSFFLKSTKWKKKFNWVNYKDLFGFIQNSWIGKLPI